jgi:predicted transposase/invertase (TIGR01784 family)
MPCFKKPASQLVTYFDRWLYAIKNLQKLRAQPPQLQENIFEKLFSEAETAKLNPEEMKTYQESLKAFRDNQNAMDYMHQKGKEKGRLVARTQAATRLKQINLPVE